MQPKKFCSILGSLVVLVIGILSVARGAFAQGHLKVLYQFTGGNDGAHPYARLILDSAGNIYGTTWEGGTDNLGTVFKLTPNPNGTWAESVLYSFTGGEYRPYAGLNFDAAGNLYGTTIGEGGTFFELEPNPDGSWTEYVLYRFVENGYYPYATLVFDAAGNLYGTTPLGGTHGNGVVFQLRPSADGTWTESVIHNFTGGSDGTAPISSVIFDSAGNLYGTTQFGGSNGYGTVFRLMPNPDGTWTEIIIHNFTGGRDGASPGGSLTLDAAGSLYGTAYSGGAYGLGTAFQLKPNTIGQWTAHELHQFTGGKDGANPFAGLAFDALGNLFGTTTSGGTYQAGTLFELRLNRTGRRITRTVHQFTGGKDGAYPYARLLFDGTGNLYGTTFGGGVGYGVVFQITP